MIECPNCGNSNDNSAHYCQDCGQSLSMSDNRPPYAAFWRRVLAYLIDHTFIFIAYLFIGAIIQVLTVGDKEFPDWVLYLYMGIVFFYFTIFECSPWQATFGKRICHIKVANVNMRRIGFGRSFWRNIAKNLSAITVIGFLTPLFTSRKIALHDLIASTLVVKGTVQNSVAGSMTKTANKHKPIPKPVISSVKAEPSGININSCPEEKLAGLPGIGPVLARQAVVIREERGGFHSMEELGAALGFDHAIMERLRPLIIFGKTNNQSDPEDEHS